jgi:hypothetical protein
VDAPTRADAQARLARLKTDAARVVAIDFFGANARETLDGLLATLGTLLQEHGKRCGAAILPGWVLGVIGLLEAGSFELTQCLTLTTT